MRTLGFRQTGMFSYYTSFCNSSGSNGAINTLDGGRVTWREEDASYLVEDSGTGPSNRGI